MGSNKEKPFFSVIIPTLNEEDCLPILLENLTRQTFSNFEVIVIDADSKDKTRQKALSFKEKLRKFTFIKSDKKNVCYQRNIGSKKAQAEWLIFLDADDVLPNYFLQGIKYHVEMLNPDILSSWIEPDSRNRKDKTIATFMNIFIDLEKRTKRPYLLEAFLAIKIRSFEKLGGFDESLPWGEGNDLLKKAVKRKMKFSLIKNPKYIYSLRRIRKQGALKTFRNVAKIELARLLDKQIPFEQAKRLYPMEGGKYFEIDDKNITKIEKVVLNLLQLSSNGDSKVSLIKKFLNKKIF